MGEDDWEARCGSTSPWRAGRRSIIVGVSRSRVLYLSYDGVLEPLGQSQVLAYLERLCADFAITLLTFEKPGDMAKARQAGALRQRLSDHGISWHPRRYHKRPPVLSTAFDIILGTRHAQAIASRERPAIVHARSYVPSVVALAVKRRTGAKFIFDMRGYWVDEKVEAGSWRHGGMIYRLAKRFERRFLGAADAIVSLTHEGVRCLPELGFDSARKVPISVIPTCVDTQRFRPGPKDRAREAQLGLAGRRVIGCIGTMSNRYLRGETLGLLARVVRAMPNVHVLIATRDDHEQLARDAANAGLDAHRLALVRASPEEMPDVVRLLDVGVFFMKPLFAQTGSAATKMAEMLACGVPLVVNDGVADSSAIVRETRVGLVLANAADATLEASVSEVTRLFEDQQIKERCRETAVRLFDVETGARRYRELYERLLSLGLGIGGSL